jgi:hypothetical protein
MTAEFPLGAAVSWLLEDGAFEYWLRQGNGIPHEVIAN